jgi:hypothetical protein
MYCIEEASVRSKKEARKLYWTEERGDLIN